MKNKLLLYSMALMTAGAMLAPGAVFAAGPTTLESGPLEFELDVPVLSRWQVPLGLDTDFGALDHDDYDADANVTANHRIFLGDGTAADDVGFYIETNCDETQAGATAFSITVADDHGTTAVFTDTAPLVLNLTKAAGGTDVDIDVIVSTIAQAGAAPTLGTVAFDFEDANNLSIAAASTVVFAGNGRSPLNMCLDIDESSITWTEDKVDIAGDQIGFTLQFTAAGI